MDDLRVDVSVYKECRDLMVDILKEVGFEFEMLKGGFFVFLKLLIEDEVVFCVYVV